MKPDPGRVLVVRIDKVGDLVLATPAIRNLRETWPAARITVLVSPQNADVLRGWTGADELLVYDSGWSWRWKTRMWRSLSARRFDVAIVLSPALDGFLAAFATRAGIRGGVVYSRRLVTRWLSPLLTPHRTVVHIDEALARGGDIPHEVDQSLTALDAIGVRARRLPLEIALDPADRDWARDVVTRALPRRTYAALHLSNHWFAGGGSGHDLRTLLEALLDRAPIESVVVTHGPADDRAVRLLGDALTGDGRVATVGGVSFGRWAAVLAASELVITRDTGALHVAAACRRPVIAIYEDRTLRHCSQQWAPWMVPHRILHSAPWPDLGPAIGTAARDLMNGSRPAAAAGEIA